MGGSRVSKVALAATAFFLSRAAEAGASSLTDYFGPREISVGESSRADAQGSLATTLNPAGLALGRQLVFEGSYGYRPTDSASTVAVSACDSTVPVPGCFYYHYLTSQLEGSGGRMSRRVHEFGIATARALSRRISFGLNTRYFNYKSSLPAENDASGFAIDAGLTIRATDAIQLGVVGYNLLAADSVQYPMGIGGGLALRPAQALSIAFDGVWNLDLPEGDSGRYGGGIEYFIQGQGGQAGYPLRFGAVYDNQIDATYLTAGLGLTTMKLGIDIGARRQVGGSGDEFIILGGLRLFGPNLP